MKNCRNLVTQKLNGLDKIKFFLINIYYVLLLSTFLKLFIYSTILIVFKHFWRCLVNELITHVVLKFKNILCCFCYIFSTKLSYTVTYQYTIELIWLLQSNSVYIIISKLCDINGIDIDLIQSLELNTTLIDN